ncbi:MAG: hypothetical protein J2P17_22525, partial [Mycobacterium sp.]|nr:hypothetical protein [Mycobacterium sp.]
MPCAAAGPLLVGESGERVSRVGWRGDALAGEPVESQPSEPSGRGELVWTVGTPDAGPFQFSDAWYRRAGQQEPTFYVGRSDPSRDWPRRQPTSLDARHGFCTATATIVFGAPAVGRMHYELVLYLHCGHGPRPEVDIAVNGRFGRYWLNVVRGDRRRLVGPSSPTLGWATVRVPIPRDNLVAGTNRVVIGMVHDERPDQD